MVPFKGLRGFQHNGERKSGLVSGVIGMLSLFSLHSGIAQCPTPSVSVSAFTCGTSPTITASGSTGIYRWYNVPTGGSPLSTGSSFNPGSIYQNSNQTFYVEAVDNLSSPTCISPRTAILTQPSPLSSPSVSGAGSLNCGGTLTMSATSSAPMINWFTQPTGGMPVFTGSSFTTPPMYGSGATYYVEAATATAPIVSQTYVHTGSGNYTWVVPAGVTSIQVDMAGGSGGNSNQSAGGLGGRVQATLPVTPGQTLYIYVGGQGQTTTSGWANGGYNGGAQGYSSCSSCGAGGGGGSSDIRVNSTSTGNRQLVAGGGGGAGYNCGGTNNERGGEGGGLTAGAGWYCNSNSACYSGQGGTQSNGGASNNCYTGGSGSLLNGAQGYGGSNGNGGGGGGYYGGGGGAYAGGGGGSSFTHASATNVTHTAGYQTGHGYVTITYSTQYCASARVPANVTVNSIGASPVVTSPVTAYCGGIAALTASGSTGNYAWYGSATGGNLLGTGSTFSPANLTPGTQTYYVAGINATTAPGSVFTFNYTGSATPWTVPAGVTSIEVDVYGASGGESRNSSAGLGGRTRARINVTPGQTLNLYVGGEGQTSLGNTGWVTGGWNGGADGYNNTSSSSAGGGGGASDIRIGGTSLSNRVVVAGGGGGAGYNCSGNNPQKGGNGGGLVGENGTYCNSLTDSYSGRGGTQSSGGCGQSYGNCGSLGNGGQAWGSSSSGGGGGGYYGGSGSGYGGGGGGSSFANSSLTSNVQHNQGVQVGNGRIIIRIPADGYCETQRVPVVVTTTSQPLAAPLTIDDTVACGTASALLQASGSGTLSWYTSPAGGSPLAVGNSLNVTPTFAPQTYYVEDVITQTSPDTTFQFTGGMQVWTVPAGVTSIQVNMAGASGGNATGSRGGLGGRVTGTIPVTPGQPLYIYVGGEGVTGNGLTGWVNGGFNGGGRGYLSSSANSAGGGGGASDIRMFGASFSARVMVAGGGGGAGYDCSGGTNRNRGGDGGGLAGNFGWYCSGNNSSYSGQGGGQSSGGTNGTNYGGSASFGNGAQAWGSSQSGGGGGGWYGGGGGYAAAGGGGSSYTAPNVTNVNHTQGFNRGAGFITISYSKSCVSQRAPVTIHIDSVQAPVISGSATGCAPQIAALTATGGSGTYQWYDAPGGNLLDTGLTYSPSITDTTMIFLNYVDNNGCTSRFDTVQLDVTPTPTANIQNPGILCASYAPLNLVGGYPTGTWAGTGITSAQNGTFNPSLANLGPNQIVFTASTSNGCTNADTLMLDVFSGPSTSITPLNNSSFCLYNAPVQLTASNVNGSWNGPAVDVVTGLFDPSQLMPGTYTIYHEVTDNNGCFGNDSVIVSVQATPDASILGPVGNICANAPAFNLNAATPGGVWSGNGITSITVGTFDPSQAGSSSQIAYAVSQNGCADTTQITLTITPAPLAVIQPITNALCDNGGPVTLVATGGTGMWSGNGITNMNAGTFSPNVAGAGTAMVYYTLTGTPCPHMDSTQILVEAQPQIQAGGALIFCEGQQVSLSASPASGYQWFLNGTAIPNATTPTLVANLPGQYTVANLSQGSCQSPSAATNITVYPKPAIVSLTANTVCEGNSSQFSQNATLSSGNLTGYQWTFGDGNTGNGANTQHMYANAGNYTAQLVVVSNLGCSDTLTTSVMVNPNPVVNAASASDVCLNNPVQFNGAASVAAVNNASVVQHQWQFGNGATGNGATAAYVFGTPGIYHFNYTAITNHGCATSQTGTVEVYNNPTAQFIHEEGCQASSLQFVDLSSADVAQWNWNFGDGNASASASPTHSYATAGTFPVTLTVTNGNGCLDATSALVTVLPAPNAQFVANHQGSGFYQFTPANLSASASYVWSFGDGATSTQMSPNYSYANPGTYYVCLTVSRNGCETMSCDSLVVTSSAGTNAISQGQIQVYPNPFTAYVQVTIDLNESANTELKLMDITGKTVASFPQGMLAAGQQTLTLNTETLGLSAGTYLLELQTGSNTQVFHMIHVK